MPKESTALGVKRECKQRDKRATRSGGSTAIWPGNHCREWGAEEMVEMGLKIPSSRQTNSRKERSILYKVGDVEAKLVCFGSALTVRRCNALLANRMASS
jgi:hypothetical protein